MHNQSGRHSKKRLPSLHSTTLALILLILTGCSLEGLFQPTVPFQWAVINTLKITNELEERAFKQNPFSEELKDEAALHDKKNILTTKIRLLEDELTGNCLKIEEERANTGKSKLSVPNTNESDRIQYEYLSSHSWCGIKASNDNKMKDLTMQLNEINNYFTKKRDYQHKVRKAVRNTIPLVIKERFENEFDLILSDRGGQQALYNKSSIVVDITDKLLEHISSSDARISIQ